MKTKDRKVLLSLMIFWLVGCTPPVDTKEVVSSNAFIEYKDSSVKLCTEPIQDFDTIYQFLIDNSIIPEGYPKSGILSQETIEIESYKIRIAKFAYDTTLKQDTIVPIQNILYTRNDTEIVCYKLIPAINEDDFRYLFEKDSFLVFDNYSSPLGYTELYLYNSQNNELLKSEKLDEADQFDSVSFKVNRMSFKVSNYADSIVTKKLQKIDWDSCQR